MRRRTTSGLPAMAALRAAGLAAALTALAATLLAASGCGSGASLVGASPSPKWVEVAQRSVSGAQSTRVDFGVVTLGSQLRLAWELSGPKAPPVTFTLRVIRVKDNLGFGTVLTPAQQPNGAPRKTESGMVLGPIWPGVYRAYFSQRFLPAKGPGYDMKLTLYTLLKR